MAPFTRSHVSSDPSQRSSLSSIGKQSSSTFVSMVDFFGPNSRALLPTFHTFCPDGVSFCPDSRPPTPVLYSAVTYPFGDMYVHKTPPHHHHKTPLFKNHPPPPPPALPRLAPRPPAPAPASRRPALRWKMRSNWSASTCRAPPRELQRKWGGARVAA